MCSCGGSGVARRRVVGSDGQMRATNVVSTPYVWQWTSLDRSRSKVFTTQDEGREWIKGGYPGSLALVAATSAVDNMTVVEPENAAVVAVEG